MRKMLAKTYDPQGIEDRIYKNWEEKKYFHAEVDHTKTPFTIVIPPPNITGQLHMGHALDNTMQDILIRWKRMQGYNTPELYVDATVESFTRAGGELLVGALGTLLLLRADGRLPGSIQCAGGKVEPQFNKYQGFCFPFPALNLYYLIGKDRDYLAEFARRGVQEVWQYGIAFCGKKCLIEADTNQHPSEQNSLKSTSI